ncbi:hypothetical protein, partial [Xanthomonas phaseoli]|uniref:hypothetical protein n=1 Tax=Xanthomonas phaseoli TaxID=1985254 RepID=UPI001E383FC6
QQQQQQQQTSGKKLARNRQESGKKAAKHQQQHARSAKAQLRLISRPIPWRCRSTFNARPVLAAKNCIADTRISRAVAPVLNSSLQRSAQMALQQSTPPITRS